MKIRDRILIIEDDRSILKFIKTIMHDADYDVLTAESGADAFSIISSSCPDLVILDLGLPDIDGITVIESVRKWTSMPIIVVSARTHYSDKVEALDKGADDYITKPFSSEELLARVRVALRHKSNVSALGQTFKTGGLKIDYEKHLVTVDGVKVHLTLNEYRILKLLSTYPGKVLTYDFIMKELWGPKLNNSNQILRVNMANLRRKIESNPAEPMYLFTEVGVGYMLSDGETASDN